MVRALVKGLLLKEIYWWQWKGPMKFFLWLGIAIGFVGFGLVQLDKSESELRSEGR
jgi:hypothetical protein